MQHMSTGEEVVTYMKDSLDSPVILVLLQQLVPEEELYLETNIRSSILLAAYADTRTPEL